MREQDPLQGAHQDDSVREVITTCIVDCGGACPLRVRVRNGRIESIKAHDDGQLPPIRACVRGLLYHHRVYAENRIRYPMQRVGPRGAGEFQRISWDEAIRQISQQLQRVITAYGPEAVMECAGAGAFKGVLQKTHRGPMGVLFDRLGGRTTLGTNASFEGAMWAKKYTLGGEGVADANSFEDLLNTQLIVLWALNLVETRFGSSSLYWLKRARDQGIRILYVDPCFTDTAKVLNAEWIPIRPGTDTALLNALAYVMFTEGLCDAAYLDRYVQGVEEYHAYLRGDSDGVPKTPRWAAAITGVSEEQIIVLAREFAAAKPAALIQGWAPGRTAYGEQYHRAALALQALTGNIGIAGGSASACGIETQPPWIQEIFGSLGIYHIPKQPSAIRQGGHGVEVHSGLWADAVLQGRQGGYPSDVKLIYVVGHNLLNQRPNIQKSIDAFLAAEFVVCQDQLFTPTTAYADIVLPVTTSFENEDISTPWVKGNYVIFANRVIDPLWEAKSDLDIARLLAQAMGISEFFPDSDDTMLRQAYDRAGLSQFLDYETFKQQGILRLPKAPTVAFQQQIQDPQQTPFQTPSGKIELAPTAYLRIPDAEKRASQVKQNYHKVPSVPTFVPHHALPSASRAKQYPLQLVTPHHRHLINSQGSTFEGIRQLHNHVIWIHPQDAEVRQIHDGDCVQVYNERGIIEVPAKVTARIMAGVVRCYQGAWYAPNKEGIDKGGNVNVLLDDQLNTSGGASNCNTCLVNIRPASPSSGTDSV